MVYNQSGRVRICIVLVRTPNIFSCLILEYMLFIYLYIWAKLTYRLMAGLHKLACSSKKTKIPQKLISLPRFFIIYWRCPYGDILKKFLLFKLTKSCFFFFLFCSVETYSSSS
jgi:hypothetical protein